MKKIDAIIALTKGECDYIYSETNGSLLYTMKDNVIMDEHGRILNTSDMDSEWILGDFEDESPEENLLAELFAKLGIDINDEVYINQKKQQLAHLLGLAGIESKLDDDEVSIKTDLFDFKFDEEGFTLNVKRPKTPKKP